MSLPYHQTAAKHLMTANPVTIPPTLMQLGQMAYQLQQLASQLSAHHHSLDAEFVGYVQEGSANLLNKLHELANRCVHEQNATDPLDDRRVRHDVKNIMAVPKGFTDLLIIDIEEGHPAVNTLLSIQDGLERFQHLLDENRPGVTQPCMLS